MDGPAVTAHDAAAGVIGGLVAGETAVVNDQPAGNRTERAAVAGRVVFKDRTDDNRLVNVGRENRAALIILFRLAGGVVVCKGRVDDVQFSAGAGDGDGSAAIGAAAGGGRPFGVDEPDVLQRQVVAQRFIRVRTGSERLFQNAAAVTPVEGN